MQNPKTPLSLKSVPVPTSTPTPSPKSTSKRPNQVRPFYLRHLSLTLLLLWAVFIFIMSSFPAELSSIQSDIFILPLHRSFPEINILDLTTIVRKFAHLWEYIVLGLLFSITFNAYVKSIFLAIPASFLYAITDEIHQIFVPGRSCQPLDVLIDTIGSIIGLIIFILFTKLAYLCYNKKHGRNRSQGTP